MRIPTPVEQSESVSRESRGGRGSRGRTLNANVQVAQLGRRDVVHPAVNRELHALRPRLAHDLALRHEPDGLGDVLVRERRE